MLGPRPRGRGRGVEGECPLRERLSPGGCSWVEHRQDSWPVPRARRPSPVRCGPPGGPGPDRAGRPRMGVGSLAHCWVLGQHACPRAPLAPRLRGGWGVRGARLLPGAGLRPVLWGLWGLLFENCIVDASI